MRQALCHQLSIAAVAGVVFFTNLGVARLWDQDEAYFSRSAVEMHQREEWVVPYFNNDVFAHKPPVMFWLMRIGFEMFGVTEFAARFWSAVFGVATALLVYHLGRRLFNPQVGLWAGMAMGTALMFDVVARAATPDSFLVFFSALALFVFTSMQSWGASRLESASSTARTRDESERAIEPTYPRLEPLPWAMCVIMYAAMGVAVLVKGPIGIVLPGAVIGLFLLTRDPLLHARGDTFGDRLWHFCRRFAVPRVLRTMWAMRPFTALAMLLLVAGPWFMMVGVRTNGQFLREFFGEQNLGRFANAMDNHSGGVWYYIPAILVGFFPWSIFGIPTSIDLMRRCLGHDTYSAGAKFIASWIVVYVGFFSLAGTKLPSYVLPAYPALALATASFIDRWLTRPASVHRWWPRLAFGSMLLVGIITAMIPQVLSMLPAGSSHSGTGAPSGGPFGISTELLDDIRMLVWLGCLLIAGGVAGIMLGEIRRQQAAAVGLVTTAVAFAIGLFAVIAVRVDRHQPTPALAQSIRQHATTGTPRVAQFGYFRPSLVYYADARVERCKNPDAVADFLKQDANSFVVTKEEHYLRMAALLPADVTVVDRRPEFPQQGTVVVLGRKPSVARRDEGNVK